MASFLVASESGFDMERMKVSGFWDGAIESSTIVTMENTFSATAWERLTLVGQAFVERAKGWFPGGGVVNRIIYESSDGSVWQIDGLSMPVVDLLTDGDGASDLAVRLALLDGSDDFWGHMAPDRLRGYGGDDTIRGLNGNDDLQGNTGRDIIFGGHGDDWVVGGKDDDLLYGDERPGEFGSGADIVLGNLGNDTCYGGAGADTVRGGQGDDVLAGDAGADWLAGDRGDDTISGGAGADTFHSHGEAGIDRVLDFNAAEGDRVNLLAGSTYSVAQVGADAVVSIGGGAQVILVGVSLSSLPAGWIF